MIAIPLLLLALAAGIYLLIKATTQYLSPVFKVLSWVVIVLSLVTVFVVLAHGLHHFKRMHDRDRGMRQERIIINEGGDEMMDSHMGGGCKMVGDSVELDKATCEKLMGKDSCDKICVQRGKCILSVAECTKLCGGSGRCGMMDGKGGCSMMKGNGETKECCKHGEMKECCKKK